MSKYAKARQDNRMKDYKQSFNADDFKKRREESIISIRRQRREENILKRRNMDITEEVDVNAQNYNNHTVQQLNLLPDFVREVSSNDVNLQISGTIGIRRLLSIQINPPIDEVIHSGVIPTLVQFLGRVDNTKLQFEAAWALTNVASGNTQQTLAIIHAHAIPAFVAQLGSPEVSVREQAVWALGNIAGDSYQCRDELLNNNVLARLLPLTMEQNIKPSLRRNAVWTISNLCRGKPAPPFPVVSIAIPYLAELIKSNDAQVVTDACWALSYLSDGDNARIQAVIEAGICERVVVNLMHQSQAVQTPSLRIVGNIVTGDDVQTQHVIDYHVLPRLKNMLDNPSIKKAIKKEVCWTISNITAGPSYQIQAVMDANIFESLIHHLIYSDFDVKKEAAWAIANATSSGSLEQIKFMVSKGCIRPLCDLLETNDARIVAVALEALENILERGNVDNDNDTEEENNYALAIEDASGVPAIEKLQLHVNQSIADKASSIISKYFNADTEEETDDEELAPTSNQDSFSFGMGGGNNTFHFS